MLCSLPSLYFTAPCGAVQVRGGEAACQKALSDAPGEIPEDLWPQAEGPKVPEAIQSLLGLPDYCGCMA